MTRVVLLTLVLASLAAADQITSPVSAPAPAYGPPVHQQYAPAVPEVSGLPEGATYVQYPGHYSYSEPGFSVQTGYEGYLVPATYPGAAVKETGGGLGSILGLLSLLPLPKIGIALFPKVGLFLLGFLFLLLIGGAFTTAVCALTPICTITFLGLGLTRSTMRSYLTPDRLTQTTAFVLDAIDKYKELSKKVSEKDAESQSPSLNKDSKRRRR